MKKIFTFVLAMIAGFTLYANNASLLKTYNAALDAQYKLDMKALLSYMHPEYTEIDSEGKVIKFAALEKYIHGIQIMKNIIAGKYTLLDIVELEALSEEKTLSENERKQIKAMENTAEGKKMMAEIKKNLPEMQKEMKKLFDQIRDDLKTHKLIFCEVHGNTGVIVYKMKDSDKGKMEITVDIWEKVRGKWLCKKSVSKFE